MEPTDPDKETFTLTFDAQGGTTVKAQKVEEGAAVTNLPKTEREGYKFLGWFDAAEGGNRVTRINAMSGDMTLYAQWKEKDPTDPEDPEKTVHTVTFDTQGGEEILHRKSKTARPDETADNRCVRATSSSAGLMQRKAAIRWSSFRKCLMM